MQPEHQTIQIIRADSTPLFPDELQVSNLRKELGASSLRRSNRARIEGRVPHLINMENAKLLSQAVNIQETCIRAKRDATVGLGFETEEEKTARARKRELDEKSHDIAMNPPPVNAPPKTEKKTPTKKEDEGASEEQVSRVEEILGPLCDGTFQAVLDQAGEDYEETGNGYIEVVRDEGGSIVSLYHMPACDVHVFNEDEAPHYHYEVQPSEGDTTVLKYAQFGDIERLTSSLGSEHQQDEITELIHFRQPTSRSREYGYPSWLSCVPWLELAQKIMQYDFDYFDNRAVPDLMVLITGAQLHADQMKNLKDSLKDTVGPGKRHRTMIASIPGEAAKVQIERLNADNRERFIDQWTNIQLQVVSTHRVPPLLAGVVLSGKMAAANELPNALVAFQTLYVQQHQGVFESTLTAAFSEENLGLTRDDFRLKQVTDYYDMGQVDTMSRMRETAVSAAQNGRKLEDGLKD